ncbi:hypothetical protein [Aestuariivita boseongensis]|uniref:hypothetical protein n=1 Tax=Aestuariivita boseongensis TaxID=1470562 RepID=UPI000680D83C|nr:hypothetical protein [Aestuariivita boseongensis]
MTRKSILNTVTAAALLIPGVALADTQWHWEKDATRINNGMAEFDDKSIAMSSDTFIALANSRGEVMSTIAGDVIGVITNVDTSENGNPELVVELADESAIPADTLVVAVQPGNVTLMENRIMLDTSLAELKTKATSSGVRDAGGRVTVTLF